MKILFVAGGSSGVVFSLIPLAQSAKNAGHEVVMAAPEDCIRIINGAGVPGFAVTSKVMKDFLYDRRGVLQEIPEDLHERYLFNGRCFGRYAAACVDGLTSLIDRWQPDLVVGGVLAFAAPLVAAYAGVPYVKHAVDMGEPRTIDLAAAAELGPELEAFGLYEMPSADLFVDTCPPSLRTADAPAAQLMRYVPYTSQRPLAPWMFDKGDRPRVLVSAGSRVTKDSDFEILSGLVTKVASLDVELLVAAPDTVVDELGTLPDNVRAGWIPLDVVARTCDLVVSHAGGNTVLGSMAAGVPQILIPYLPYVVGYTERLSAYGASRMVRPEDDSPENIADACQEVLATPEYRERARAISAEMAELPLPADVVGVLEGLVA
ncbi:glycosyltransferase [Streptomyces sp. NPDC057939]|uniref:glycosyltransferase n=1 Tax=Streptomyces sp. NPDC057939 TaxID=3346284 RepID=UPI0036F012A0